MANWLVELWLLPPQKDLVSWVVTDRHKKKPRVLTLPFDPTSLPSVFSFYQNLESGKTTDVEEGDGQVNVSFCDVKTGDWVSISGKAVINKDKSKVKRHWNSMVKAWFDDKKDGVHTGDENDPRVVMLDVHPEEIRYYSQEGTLKFYKDVAAAALGGAAASPGKLVILQQDEIALGKTTHTKH